MQCKSTAAIIQSYIRELQANRLQVLTSYFAHMHDSHQSFL